MGPEVTLLKIFALCALLEAGLLAVGATLYWEAYRKMKQSPIIKWVAGTQTAGAAVALLIALTSLFYAHSPQNIMYVFVVAIIIAKLVLSYAVFMFIKVSLTPQQAQKDPIKGFEKDVKKHAKSQKKTKN